jgi:hypothetical protein
MLTARAAPVVVLRAPLSPTARAVRACARTATGRIARTRLAPDDGRGAAVDRARRAVGERLARLAPWSGLFSIGGFWLGIPLLMLLALVLIAVAAYGLAT